MEARLMKRLLHEDEVMKHSLISRSWINEHVRKQCFHKHCE